MPLAVRLCGSSMMSFYDAGEMRTLDVAWVTLHHVRVWVISVSRPASVEVCDWLRHRVSCRYQQRPVSAAGSTFLSHRKIIAHLRHVPVCCAMQLASSSSVNVFWSRVWLELFSALFVFVCCISSYLGVSDYSRSLAIISSLGPRIRVILDTVHSKT